MKRYLLFIFCFLYSIAAIAQTDTATTGTTTKLTAKVVSSKDIMKMFGNVTDKTIYDREGNIIDPDTAEARVRSFNYQVGYGKPAGQTEYKRMMTKIDLAVQLKTYQLIKTMPPLQLKSAKLQDGLILDLKPLAKKTDTAKLRGKALLLIFWCDQCYSGSQPDSYKEINDLTTTYANPAKLEVIAITHHPFDVAEQALKRNPILNAHHIFEASRITNEYETDNRPVIILTNKDHQIIFSAAQHPAVTPWMLNKLLNEDL